MWGSALYGASRLAPSGWWRRRPYLPLPSARWLAFRFETAYGDPRATPPGEDLVAFLRFVRQARRARRALP